MSKLTELKQMVAELFQAATDKTIIEKSALVSNKLEEVAQENQELVDKQAELLKDYKEAILHTSFTKKNETPDPTTPTAAVFDDNSFFENWAATHDSDGKEIK